MPDAHGTIDHSAVQKWEEVATFLRSGNAFPQRRPPEMIETHISLLFLTEQHVYKLKKPVHFDFLDYSTVEARQRACEAEVTLNRRLAPDVYLGAMPITVGSAGQLAIAGDGEPIEWVVKMRRLPKEKMLDVLIAKSPEVAIDTASIASVLNDFYQASPAIRLGEGELARLIGEHVKANRRELLRPEHRLPEHLIKRIHGRHLQFVKFETQLLEERMTQGHVVDGHGDLRPEHICMEDHPVVFDCVEFSGDLRRLDVLDELSFFAMECERLGVKAIGDDVIDSYSRATGDWADTALLDFYKSYRACVRAKVATLRAAQLRSTEIIPTSRIIESYLRLADRTFGWSSAPTCVVVRGLAGSGKSTLATALAEALGMEPLQTDLVRLEMLRGGEADLAYGAGRYSPESRAAVYESMFEKGAALLSERISVIFDACFLSHDLQNRVAALTRTIGVPLLIVRCWCPDDVAIARIVERSKDPGCLSKARPEHLMAQRQEDEGDTSGAQVLSLDTSSGTTEAHVGLIVDTLRLLLRSAGSEHPAEKKVSAVTSSALAAKRAGDRGRPEPAPRHF